MKSRIEKWAAKLSGDNRKRLYDAQKDQMVKLEKIYFRDAEKIQNQVKQMVQSQPVILHHYYMDFALEIYSKQRKFSGQTLINELRILDQKWEARGLNATLLNKIKQFYVPNYTPPPIIPVPYIWIVDLVDKKVYKYTMAGVYVSSFDTTGHGADNIGIATDGINIWIVDYIEKEVFKYTMEGVYVSSFDTSAHGADNYGITTNGINIWIVDGVSDEVYKYTMEGVYVSSFDTSAHGISNYGITTDGINIWIVDFGDTEVYKYTMTGVYVSSFDTSAHGIANIGITTDGINIWIVDAADTEVFKYTMTGVYVSSFDTSAHGAVNVGITTDKRFI